MEIYCVGGSVRDELLGRPVSDRDWVVVGATPEQMVAQGFRPVGRDFPVFLHPQSHEEYALARTERKVARGYRGFSIYSAPDVTLEQDLRRRDLTINAIARTADGRLIDPCGGLADLQARTLRHVSDAFSEDPVRILRLARFAARFSDFSIAPETMALARKMVDAGEVDALVAERVWQELAKGLMEGASARMLRVLEECGALPRMLPELARANAADPSAWAHTLRQLDAAANDAAPLPIRYAVLIARPDQPAVTQASSERLRAPIECTELARLVAEHCIDPMQPLSPEPMLTLLERIDALRRPERAAQFAAVCARLHAREPATSSRHLTEAIDTLRTIDAGAIADELRQQHPGASDVPLRIRDALRSARLLALRSMQAAPAHPPSSPSGDRS